MSKLADSVVELTEKTSGFVRMIGSGIVFLLAFGFLKGDRFAFLSLSGKSDDFSTFLAALYIIASGIGLYTIHRGLTYPWIGWAVLGYVIWRNKRAEKSQALRREVGVMRRLHRKDDQIAHQHWDQWASQVHFLYCSSLGVFLAIASTPFLGDKNWFTQGDYFTVSVASASMLVSLLSAVCADYELSLDEVTVMDELKQKEKDIPVAPE